MRKLIAAIIVVGILLRLSGVFDDFWLDEIWTWWIARSMNSIADLWRGAEARSDNNHLLVTLFMYLTGDLNHWWVWRIPSLLAGAATLIVAARFLARRGRAEATAGAILFSLSYPLIFYSSEARGYALAVCFTLLAVDALDRYLDRPTTTALLTYWLACILGLVSHLTFIHALAGMAAWSALRLRPIRPAVLARLHGVGFVALALLYLGFVRHLVIGGAPATPIHQAIFDAVGRLFGSGDSYSAAVAASCVAAGMFVATIVLLRRAGDPLWSLCLVGCVISPAVVLGWQLIFVTVRQPIAPRYFLVCYAIFLLGLSVVLTTLWRHGRTGRAVAACAVSFFIVANVWQTTLFLRTGRGHYSDAVAHIGANSPQSIIPVLCDHPLRTGRVLAFYAPRILNPSQSLGIYNVSEQRPEPPMWIIVSSNVRKAPPSPSFHHAASGSDYVFDREFDYAGLSGYSWYLYRRAGRD